MTQRVIDNKRIDLTDSEWNLYQEICKSYDGPHRAGKDLFVDLFETNDKGQIIFLKPPTQKYSSMEVYMFLVGVMVHQHLGEACDRVDQLSQRMIENEIEKDKRTDQKFAAIVERIENKEAELDKKIQSVNDMLTRGSKIIKDLNKKRRETA